MLNKLKEEGQTIILNILEQKFLYFFEKVYYANLKKFDLSSFCEIQSLIGQNFDLEIDFTKNPKVKTFNDLLNKEKIKDLDYENKMHKCVVSGLTFSRRTCAPCVAGPVPPMWVL